MSKFDHPEIDGWLLQTRLALFEEQSVTRGAARPEMTQSVVSPRFDRLRDIVGGPLSSKVEARHRRHRARRGARSSPLLRGSTRLATLTGLLRAGLDVTAPPFDRSPMPMHTVGHLGHLADPIQQWLRSELQAVVPPALAAAELRAA